jgi:hypothetical protein
MEMKESSLSKIILPMPQIGTAIVEWESPTKLAARIEKAANELASDVADALAARKTSGKRGRGKKSTRPESRISALEVVSARPVGHGKKSFGRSSGLNVTEKASHGAAGGKPKRALNLFASNSSTSGDESASPRRPRKRTQESSIPKQASEAAPVRGIFYCFACYQCSTYYV